jgi:hypothetical protein
MEKKSLCNENVQVPEDDDFLIVILRLDHKKIK